jgi:hypothetical protein
MPTEFGISSSTIILEGSLRISCEDFSFRLRYKPGCLVADFPSFGMLARAGKMSRDIGSLIADLPPLPAGISLPSRMNTGKLPLANTEFLIAVNARPVGKISFATTKPKFVPTPLRFFNKV